jgi:hypothetical protein
LLRISDSGKQVALVYRKAVEEVVTYIFTNLRCEPLEF